MIVPSLVLALSYALLVLFYLSSTSHGYTPSTTPSRRAFINSAIIAGAASPLVASAAGSDPYVPNVEDVKVRIICSVISPATDPLSNYNLPTSLDLSNSLLRRSLEPSASLLTNSLRRLGTPLSGATPPLTSPSSRRTRTSTPTTPGTTSPRLSRTTPRRTRAWARSTSLSRRSSPLRT